MNSIKPTLIEPGVRYFLNGTLKECRKFKDNYISVIFNISMILLLFALVGGFLMYRYKGKPTPAELDLKNRKKQEYIEPKNSTTNTANYKKLSNNNKELAVITDDVNAAISRCFFFCFLCF